ncbi:hypothetical protein B484DRAFT_247981 [Ochromonadaceae sp. CCMP2298]|nr:hypothetical protein B484DRAFT_247981 [Ochromonadaceae sp. CCMP2298]
MSTFPRSSWCRGRVQATVATAPAAASNMGMAAGWLLAVRPLLSPARQLMRCAQKAHSSSAHCGCSCSRHRALCICASCISTIFCSLCTAAALSLLFADATMRASASHRDCSEAAGSGECEANCDCSSTVAVSTSIAAGQAGEERRLVRTRGASVEIWALGQKQQAAGLWQGTRRVTANERGATDPHFTDRRIPHGSTHALCPKQHTLHARTFTVSTV